MNQSASTGKVKTRWLSCDQKTARSSKHFHLSGDLLVGNLASHIDARRLEKTGAKLVVRYGAATAFKCRATVRLFAHACKGLVIFTTGAVVMLAGRVRPCAWSHLGPNLTRAVYICSRPLLDCGTRGLNPKIGRSQCKAHIPCSLSTVNVIVTSCHSLCDQRGDRSLYATNIVALHVAPH